ncbi:MAG TPA: amino acid racemase [Patescibacteria group bacterium]|nr:amino acid racemase [Patescibacteria group bacterium]
MVKHVGIIAVSFEGAALCYRTFCEEAMALAGGLSHPEVSVHNHSLKHYMDFIENGDWDGVVDLMVSSGRKLAAAGANFAVCPDNTVHQVFEQVAKQSPVPLLSIIDVVSDECKRRGYRKVGVLGTKYTMKGPMYKEALAKRMIKMVVPDAKDRERVNSVIFDELVPEGVTESSVKVLVDVVQKLKNAGCDAVILGCTELPLVLNMKNSPLPVVDSTRLLALKALEHALK